MGKFKTIKELLQASGATKILAKFWEDAKAFFTRQASTEGGAFKSGNASRSARTSADAVRNSFAKLLGASSSFIKGIKHTSIAFWLVIKLIGLLIKVKSVYVYDLIRLLWNSSKEIFKHSHEARNAFRKAFGKDINDDAFKRAESIEDLLNPNRSFTKKQIANFIIFVATSLGWEAVFDIISKWVNDLTSHKDLGEPNAKTYSPVYSLLLGNIDQLLNGDENSRNVLKHDFQYMIENNINDVKSFIGNLDMYKDPLDSPNLDASDVTSVSLFNAALMVALDDVSNTEGNATLISDEKRDEYAHVISDVISTVKLDHDQEYIEQTLDQAFPGVYDLAASVYRKLKLDKHSDDNFSGQTSLVSAAHSDESINNLDNKVGVNYVVPPYPIDLHPSDDLSDLEMHVGILESANSDKDEFLTDINSQGPRGDDPLESKEVIEMTKDETQNVVTKDASQGFASNAWSNKKAINEGISALQSGCKSFSDVKKIEFAYLCMMRDLRLTDDQVLRLINLFSCVELQLIIQEVVNARTTK